jgi:predicted GNAT family N-acyltransferase
MFKVKSFSAGEKNLTELAFAIRTAVFVEEQGVDAALEYDHEEEARHYLLFLGEKPIATARWRETEKGIKLERFAVLPQFRNRGFGEIILQEVLKDVSPFEKRIYLHSQAKAVSFYERNGFMKEGPMFLEAGIDHFLMTYLPD